VSGISVLTAQLFTNWDYKLSVLKEKIRALFISEFSRSSSSLNGFNNILLCENNLKSEFANSDETFEIVPVKRRIINK
jgi:hypothetical protein